MKMIVEKEVSNVPEEHQRGVEISTDIEIIDTIEISDDENCYIGK